MEDVSVKIKDVTYLLEIAETESDRYDGLADNDYLSTNEGMLFVFESDGTNPMVMRGMEFPLDIIHLDGEGMINSIVTAEPTDPGEFEGGVDSRYVIELLAGEADKNGFGVGDTVELPSAFTTYIADKYAVGMAQQGAETALNPEQSKAKQYQVTTTDIPEKSDQLQVLDHDGKVISNINLGARIFSRDHTKALVAMSSKGDDEETLKQLGKMMVEMIHKQDTQKPEYSN